MDWQRKYRLAHTWGAETGIDGKPYEDFVGWDGDTNIGRIYFDQQTLKAEQWRWAVQYPKGGRPYMPNNGWGPTVADAARVVEEAWDAQKARVAAQRSADAPRDRDAP